MCYGCYVEYGAPVIINETTKNVADLVEKVYEHSLVGGNLHIILDDFNIEDDHIHSCFGFIADDIESDVDTLTAETNCLVAMSGLTVAERASALAIYEGWIGGDNEC